MTHSDIQPWFKACLKLIALGFLFLLTETAFFLICDGWHYYAETPAEKLCDMIGQSMTGAGLLGGVICWFLLLLTPKDKAA